MRRFHFSLMITTISILSAITCYLMGYWQYTRWEEKKAYFREIEARQERNSGPVGSGRALTTRSRARPKARFARSSKEAKLA